MKKLTIIALSAALTLALVVACGGGETTTTPATENAAATACSETASGADVGDSGDIDASDGEVTGEDADPDAPTVAGDSVDIDAGYGEVTGEDIDPDAPTSDGANDGEDTVSTDAGDKEVGAEVGDLAPNFTLDYIGKGSPDGKCQLTYSDYRGDSPSVVVFYRSIFCTFCVRQLNAIQAQYDEFEERGVQVVAVSSDSLNESQSRLISQDQRTEFPLAFTGANDEVPRAYDRIGHVRDGFYLGGRELADPGVFVVDADGVIAWRELGANIGHFVPASEILEQVDSL